MNLKLIIALLVGLLIGQFVSTFAKAAGDGWDRYSINHVIGLLESIDNHLKP